MIKETKQFPMRVVPGYSSSSQGIQIAIQTGANASDEDLQFFQQLGVEWAMVGIDDPTQHSAAYYKGLVKRFGDMTRKCPESMHEKLAATLQQPQHRGSFQEPREPASCGAGPGRELNTFIVLYTVSLSVHFISHAPR